VEQITQEVAVQYPDVVELSFGTLVGPRMASDSSGLDTVSLAVVRWGGRASRERTLQQETLRDWLRVRLKLDTLEMIHR
jgi:hypothetical protein